MIITLCQARLGITLVEILYRDIMLGQVRYPKAKAYIALGIRVPIFVYILDLVPESEGLYSPWNSGTKILMLNVLVPESEGLYSPWNSGTKILMLHTYILSSMFIPNLTQLMEGQVRFYRYSLLYSSIPYLTYPNLWQGRLYFTSMVIPNLALLMVGQVRLDIRI